MVIRINKHMMLVLVIGVLVAMLLALLTPDKPTAGYDRFKTVGVDKIKDGRDILVIEDTETGCLYGQVETVSYGGLQMLEIKGSCKYMGGE